MLSLMTIFNNTKAKEMHYVANQSGSSFHFLVGNMSFVDFLRVVYEERLKETWLSATMTIVLVVLYLLIVAMGLAGNGLICYIVVKTQKLRTARNYFIMNLAVSDMLLCAFCMPFDLVKLVMKNWMLGLALCKAVPYFQAINVFASTATVTAIALDRFQIIVHPTFFKDDTKRTATLVAIGAIWFVSILVGLPLLLFHKVDRYEFIDGIVSHEICLEEWPSYQIKIIYSTLVLLFQFVIPVCILGCLHWKICSYLRGRRLRNPTTPMEMTRAQKETRRNRKNSTLLMAIAVTFTVCWFPLTLLNMLADYSITQEPSGMPSSGQLRHSIVSDDSHFHLTFAICLLVAMTSASLNPLIYGWFNSNFRTEFKKALCCQDNTETMETERIQLMRTSAIARSTRRTSYRTTHSAGSIEQSPPTPNDSTHAASY